MPAIMYFIIAFCSTGPMGLYINETGIDFLDKKIIELNEKAENGFRSEHQEVKILKGSIGPILNGKQSLIINGSADDKIKFRTFMKDILIPKNNDNVFSVGEIMIDHLESKIYVESGYSIYDTKSKTTKKMIEERILLATFDRETKDIVWKNRLKCSYSRYDNAVDRFFIDMLGRLPYKLIEKNPASELISHQLVCEAQRNTP